MKAKAALVAIAAIALCAACAIGTIRRPDGTEIVGVTLGAARLESCEPTGQLAQSTGSADGAMAGPCARLSGGSVSTTFATIISGLVMAAAAYFTAGGL